MLAALGGRRLGLRSDDLLFVVLGIVPGAVVGGRLGYVLLHPDFFAGRPGAILDPGVGSLELGLAVVGGAITGVIVAALLDGDLGRWLHIAALPFLVVIGLGKLAMVLGGSGQGQPWLGDWATAYLGPGPWGSLAPAAAVAPIAGLRGDRDAGDPRRRWPRLLDPAVPARARTAGRSSWRSAPGRSPGRSWRRPGATRPRSGPFRTEQVVDLLIVAGCAVAIAVLVRRERRASPAAATG